MSYQCPTHNWSHIEKQCPECNDIGTIVGSNATGNLIYGGSTTIDYTLELNTPLSKNYKWKLCIPDENFLEIPVDREISIWQRFWFWFFFGGAMKWVRIKGEK